MKKIFLILILVLSNSVFSQQYYLSYQKGAIGCGGGVCSLISKSSNIKVYDLNDNEITSNNNIYESRPYKIVQSISCSFSCDQEEGGGGSFSSGGQRIIDFDQNKICQSLISNGTGVFRLKAYLAEVNNINNTRCIDDVITLNKDDCAGDIEFWEVSIGGQPYTQINGSENVNIIQVTYDEIFNDNSGINSTTYFRAKLLDLNIFTQPVSVVFISCSPQLLSFTPSNTQCSYSQDGGFHMNLDRDLNTNEQLVVLLSTESVPGSNVFDIIPDQGQQSTTSLTPNGDGSYRYQWPIPIYAGNYQIKYQTLNKSDAVDQDSWDSLEFSPEFTVNNPPAMQIDYTSTNVNCHGGEDGSITLKVKGGSGGYKYFLNGGTEVFFTNTNKGTDASPVSHTITGLPKSTKTIKVQDGNGCTQKE
jgi:hypothetical protein